MLQMGRDTSIDRWGSDSRFVRGIATVGHRYRKTEIEEKLDFLYRTMDSGSVMYKGDGGVADLVSKSLMALYEMCLKYDQTEYPKTFEKGLYHYDTRVFGVFTCVDSWDLKQIEHVYCNGMFWPLKGAFLSRSVMKTYFEERYRWRTKGPKLPLDQDEILGLGLPDNLNYSQINRLQNGMGFALRNDVWENKFIRSRNCFVPLNLNATE